MRRKKKLSPTKEVPDKETSSPCQYCRKCKENRVENIKTNFSMKRDKRHRIKLCESVAGDLTLCSQFDELPPLLLYSLFPPGNEIQYLHHFCLAF